MSPETLQIEALAELLARTPRLTAGYGAPDDYTRAAESLIDRGVRISGHPTQPLVRDAHGVLRFKKNAIVRFLLEAGPIELNELAMMEFSVEDRQQFAQLIGYSRDGYEELSYSAATPDHKVQCCCVTPIPGAHDVNCPVRSA